MILHFLSDSKFADYVITQYNHDRDGNELLLICDSPKAEYVKQIEKVHTISPSSSAFHDIVSNLSAYNAVVLHGLFWPWQETILRNVPQNVKVAWMFWGGDVYGRKDLIQSFLLPRSRFYYNLHKFKELLSARKKSGYQIPKELFKRIDYCLTGISEEVQFAQKYFNCTFSHLWYTYYSIEETISDFAGQTCYGKNIILGNSSTIENNHLDVIRKIRELPLSDRNIITPLSYGNTWLKNIISKEALRIWGNRFHPLSSFLPREEYNFLLLDCCIMIMPHIRPQAQGNIITGLWLGMRVFLSEKSMTYVFFKRIGAIVFSIENDLTRSNIDVLRPLSDEARKHNRDVLMKWYGKEHVMRAAAEVSKVLNS